MSLAESLDRIATGLYGVVVERRRVTARVIQGWAKNSTVRKHITTQLHLKQLEDVQNGLTQQLVKFFRQQVAAAIIRLKSFDELPHHVSEIFDPREWDEMLVNITLPGLAVVMEEAALSVFTVLGLDPRIPNVATTASEWLAGSGEELPFFHTDLPQEMLDDMADQLKRTFEQDYWKKINNSTRIDIRSILDEGLSEGWSVERMAREMHDTLGGDYPLRRGRLIARTESGNALNGARSAAIDQLGRELGPEVPVRKSWLSVLGDTTRDAHAGLDHVMSDAQGLFNLNGVMIPWPSHYTLPAKDRVNCMCTVMTDFDPATVQPQQPTVQPTASSPPRTDLSLEEQIATNERLNGIQGRMAGMQTLKEKIDVIERELVETFGIVSDTGYDLDTHLARKKNSAKWRKRKEELESTLRGAKARVEELRASRDAIKVSHRQEIEDILFLNPEDRLALSVQQHSNATDGVVTYQGEIITHNEVGSTFTGMRDAAIRWLKGMVKRRDSSTFRMRYHRLAEDQTRSFHINGGPDEFGTGVFLHSAKGIRTHVHEMAHRIEHKFEGMKAKTAEFRRFRIQRAGTEDVKMKDVFPDSGYDDWEVGNKDDFDKALDSHRAYYVGKTYSHGGGEVLTMGLEEMFEDPVSFARKDPEYFKFLIGVIQGDL